MSKFSVKKVWRAIAFPPARLPADFPFSPKDSGKLYFKSLALYVLGTLIPLGLFMALLPLLIKYDLPLADVLLQDRNLNLLIAGFAVVTFLSGFGAQFWYVRKQIHKQGKLIRDVLSLNTRNFAGSKLKLIGWGIATAMIAGLVQQGIAAIWPFQIKDQTAEVIHGMAGFSFALMAALAILGPVFEEIIFRGFLYNSIRTSLHNKLPSPDAPGYARRVMYFDLIASFSSALVFGLAHMNLAALPLYVAVGMVLAAAYRRSGSLYVSLIAHMINNAAAIVLLLVTVAK